MLSKIITSSTSVVLTGVFLVGNMYSGGSYVFADDSVSDISTYSGYVQKFQDMCSKEWALSSEWNSPYLLKNKEYRYAAIPVDSTENTGAEGSDFTQTSKAKMVQNYEKDLKDIGQTINPDTLIVTNAFRWNISAALTAGSAVYVARMNTLYNCAILDAKNQTAKYIQSKMKDSGDSEIKSAMDKQIEKNNKLIKDNGCNPVKEWSSPVDLKKQVLDNGMSEYCNYRVYLEYLDAYARKNISEEIASEAKAKKSSSESGSTDVNVDTALVRTNQFVANIVAEKERVKNVFPEALKTYVEFERYYGVHILLQFILDDYIEIRNGLRSVMNPLSQLIYKGQGASSKFGQ